MGQENQPETSSSVNQIVGCVTSTSGARSIFSYGIGQELRIKPGCFEGQTFFEGHTFILKEKGDFRMSDGMPQYCYRGRWYYEDEVELVKQEDNLTATYKVFTVGLVDEIESVSFQDAAQKMLEKHHLTSVASIAVEYDASDGGTIELVDCQIVDGKFDYRTHHVIDVKDEAREERERLAFLESGEAIEDQ